MYVLNWRGGEAAPDRERERDAGQHEWTFYPQQGGTPTWIDFGCIPLDRYREGHVIGAATLDDEGDRLQLIPGLARADHRPVGFRMFLDLTYPFLDVFESLFLCDIVHKKSSQ